MLNKSNKKIFRIILVIVLTCFTFVVCTSCKSNKKEESEQNVKPQPEQNLYPNEKEEVKTTDKNIVSNGKSSYKILVPADAGADLIAAASELKMFISESTGVELAIVNTYNQNEKYFSMGNTELFKKQNVSVDINVFTTQGYGIKTIDDNICIYGATELAVLYGVYGYLERTLNYDFFYTDVYTLDKVDTLPLCVYDIIDIPCFEYRVSSYGYQSMNLQTRRRLRLVKYEESFPSIPDVNMYHNCFTYISPEEYTNSNYFNADRNQLCYTAHGNEKDLQDMLNIVAGKMYSFFMQDTSASQIVIALNDSTTPCKCSACESDREKYGAYSSSLVKFLNKLVPLVGKQLKDANDKRAKDFKIVFYAYFYLEDAPVAMETNSEGENTFKYESDMVLDNHVAPLIAPFYMYYTKGIKDESNKKYHDNILKWNAIAENLHLWYYDVYFRDGGYLTTFDSFTQTADLYKFAYENEFCFVYPEGQTSNRVSSAFTILKGYLSSKLGWDVNYDVDMLINKYFNAMYGSEGDNMREIFDEMRVLWNKQSFEIWEDGGYCHAINLFTAQAQPFNLVKDWFERMKAIEQRLLIQGENKSAENVRIEMVSPLYILVRVHSASFSNSDIYNYKVMLKNYLNEFNITHISQDITTEYFIQTLGI